MIFIGILIGAAVLFAVGAVVVTVSEVRGRRQLQRRREQPATLEGAGSHLTSRRP